MNLYLLRPPESTDALVVVAKDIDEAITYAQPLGRFWPNAMLLGHIASGIHPGVLVEGHLYVEKQAEV